MTDSRVSREVVEVVKAGAPSDTRVSREVVEVVQAGAPSDARVSRQIVEVVIRPTAQKRRVVLGRQARTILPKSKIKPTITLFASYSPIAKRGTSTATRYSAATASPTVSVPAGLQVGDTMVMVVAARGGSMGTITITGDDGWVQKYSGATSATSPSLALQVFTRSVRAGDPSTWVITGSTPRICRVSIIGISGISANSPVMTTPTGAVVNSAGVNTPNVVWPTVTTMLSGAVLGIAVLATSDTVVTPPTGGVEVLAPDDATSGGSWATSYAWLLPSTSDTMAAQTVAFASKGTSGYVVTSIPLLPVRL